MITVRDIINKEQTQVHTIEPDATLQAAIHIMSSEKSVRFPSLRTRNWLASYRNVITSEKSHHKKFLRGL